MAGRKGLDTKDAIENYRTLLTMEYKLQREWEPRWGFFKAPQRRYRSEMRREAEAMKSASAPSLASAGQEVLQPGSSVGKWPPPPPKEDIEFINDRHRLMHRYRLLPQQRYAKPSCSSHRYGWKPTIETLGVAQHGMKKLDRTLMPDDINCTMAATLYDKNQLQSGERLT
mmetsp:Transcript_23605/g.44583  ORF Transcript_23605/g.44583 Transcript_23605/m.44583 type:complete len:170 (-) Transcript_23605:180-689(-)